MHHGFTDIFLHAGLMKTGSTSVQTSLTATAESLRSFDIHYPIFPGAASDGGAHGMALRHLIGFKTEAPFGHSEKYLDVEAAAKAFEHIQKSKERKLLLSDELLPSLPENQLRRLAKRLRAWSHSKVRFHLLIVVRDPLDWMHSARNEFLRNGFTEKDMYHPDGIMNPILVEDWMNEIIAKFNRAGLCDSLTTCRFEDVNSANRLVDTIGKWADLPLKLPDARENQSLASEFLTMLEGGHSHSGFPDHAWIQTLSSIQGTKMQPTPTEAKRWQEQLLTGMNTFCDDHNLTRYEPRTGTLDWNREKLWSDELLKKLSEALASSPLATKRFVHRRMFALQSRHNWHPTVKRRLSWFAWKHAFYRLL